jgi:hypothetical protein
MARKLSVYLSLLSNYSFNKKIMSKDNYIIGKLVKYALFRYKKNIFLKILKYGNLDRTDFYTKQKG